MGARTIGRSAANDVGGFLRAYVGHDIKAWTLDGRQRGRRVLRSRMGHDIKAWTSTQPTGSSGSSCRMGTPLRACTLDAVIGVVGFFMRMWTDVEPAGRAGIWGDVAGFFTNMYNSVTGTVSHAVGDVVNYFTNLPSRSVTRPREHRRRRSPAPSYGLPADVWNNAIHAVTASFFSDLPEAIMPYCSKGIGSKIIAGAIETRHLSAAGSSAKGLSRSIGLAEGGLVTKPILAVVGEAGPLPRHPRVDPGRRRRWTLPD